MNISIQDQLQRTTTCSFLTCNASLHCCYSSSLWPAFVDKCTLQLSCPHRTKANPKQLPMKQWRIHKRQTMESECVLWN